MKTFKKTLTSLLILEIRSILKVFGDMTVLLGILNLSELVELHPNIPWSGFALMISAVIPYTLAGVVTCVHLYFERRYSSK